MRCNIALVAADTTLGAMAECLKVDVLDQSEQDNSSGTELNCAQTPPSPASIAPGDI
jgi:hypothetical protein